MYLLKMYINLEPGIRKLSIPTITDTIIQQVTVKKIEPICEHCFSEYSYGFRPSRSYEKEMLKFLDYLNEQFFDFKKMIYVYENNKIAKVSNIK